MRNLERKRQAQEMINQLEAKREEYEQVGGRLSHYVLMPFSEGDAGIVGPCLVGAVGYFLSFLYLYGFDLPALSDHLVLVVLLVVALVVICVGVYYFTVFFKCRKNYEVMFTWRREYVDYLQEKCKDVQNDLDDYASQLAEAQPWIEAMKRVEPVITEELKFELVFIMKLEGLGAQIRSGECVIDTFDLTQEGYENLAIWVLGKRKALAKRKRIIQEFERTL